MSLSNPGFRCHVQPGASSAGELGAPAPVCLPVAQEQDQLASMNPVILPGRPSVTSPASVRALEISVCVLPLFSLQPGIGVSLKTHLLQREIFE